MREAPPPATFAGGGAGANTSTLASQTANQINTGRDAAVLCLPRRRSYYALIALREEIFLGEKNKNLQSASQQLIHESTVSVRQGHSRGGTLWPVACGRSRAAPRRWSVAIGSLHSIV